ncbi:MAG TPA: 1-phosphofructokinase [Bacillales bacterium]|nr:1-phosphofructokinase [Bacillales bacterium]
MTNQLKRYVLTITANPALDVFADVEELVPGTLHRTPPFRKNPGGKGINVAKALNAFGSPVLASGFLGGSNGRWIEKQLTKQGIATRFVPISSETRMNVKIVNTKGELTEFNSKSPELTEEDWQQFDKLLEQIVKENSWVALCGKLPEDCSVNWYEKVIQHSRKLGVSTAVDTSGEALKRAVQARPDFIKPNLEELQELTGENLSTTEEVIQAARKLTETGINTVAVTLGAKGLIVARQDEVWQVTVPKVDVKSPVGAGDSVVAGFLHGFYHQHAFTDTIRFAAACGVAAVMKEGTAHPELMDIEPLIPKIHIENRRDPS